MGLWAGIKYAINSSLGTSKFEPLNIQLDINALAQNLTTASINLVFLYSANIGLVLNRTFGLNVPEMEALTTMTEIAASNVAMTAIAASASAMGAIGSSNSAMIAVGNSSIARVAIEASDIAKNALSNSPLRQTENYAISNVQSLRRAGRVWLISQQSSLNSSYAISVRATSEGAATITAPITAGAPVMPVNRFMEYINNHTSYAGAGAQTASYVFIPCS